MDNTVDLPKDVSLKSNGTVSDHIEQGGSVVSLPQKDPSKTPSEENLINFDKGGPEASFLGKACSSYKQVPRENDTCTTEYIENSSRRDILVNLYAVNTQVQENVNCERKETFAEVTRNGNKRKDCGMKGKGLQEDSKEDIAKSPLTELGRHTQEPQCKKERGVKATGSETISSGTRKGIPKVQVENVINEDKSDGLKVAIEIGNVAALYEKHSVSTSAMKPFVDSENCVSSDGKCLGTLHLHKMSPNENMSFGSDTNSEFKNISIPEDIEMNTDEEILNIKPETRAPSGHDITMCRNLEKPVKQTGECMDAKTEKSCASLILSKESTTETSPASGQVDNTKEKPLVCRVGSSSDMNESEIHSAFKGGNYARNQRDSYPVRQYPLDQYTVTLDGKFFVSPDGLYVPYSAAHYVMNSGESLPENILPYGVNKASSVTVNSGETYMINQGENSTVKQGKRFFGNIEGENSADIKGKYAPHSRDPTITAHQEKSENIHALGSEEMQCEYKDHQRELYNPEQGMRFETKQNQRKRSRSKYSKRNRNYQPRSVWRPPEREPSKLDFTDYIQAGVEAEEHFNKKFTFRKHGDGNDTWKLPLADTMFTKPVWQDGELQAMKQELNSIKRQLSDKDISSWHNHTKYTNPAERIVSQIKRRTNAEMVTQAWAKFYEILYTFPVVPYSEELSVSGDEKENGGSQIPPNFNSVHLCEAPGAFIAALNHYIALNRDNVKWHWIGNTLNPYYEGSPSELCVVEDRLIYLTLQNWTFGRDNTGDLMEKENLEEIIQRAKCLGLIHLVTADGSIDCQTLPAEQESTTHVLHFCEIVAALSILTAGGNLIVKKFTMFESETVNLLYLLCCTFNTVHVYKPGTSKEGNSEVYIICLKYCGKDAIAPNLKKMVEYYSNSEANVSMFSLDDLPVSFLSQLRECNQTFKEYQIKTITKNVSTFEKLTDGEHEYNNIRKNKVTQLFFEQCPCTHISKSATLTSGKVKKTRYLLETDLVKSNTSRIVRTSCPVKRLKILAEFVKNYQEEFSKRRWIIGIEKEESCLVYKLEPLELSKMKFEVTKGKSYNYIKCSKLCSPKVQEAYKALCTFWESKTTQSSCVIDESLLDQAMRKYPTAEVLRGEVTLRPTSALGPLKEVLARVKKGKLSCGSSLILTNVTLLSRLQVGLLHILASAFKSVVFFTGNEMGAMAPVLVFDSFKSKEFGEQILRTLDNFGANPLEEDTTQSTVTLQVLYFSEIIEPLRLFSVFYYNIHYCLHRSVQMIINLEKMQ
ncbi:Methyltransferase activity protein [Halocaridina rubra]|uniref:Cap-specific mRNA (nucleoside-2'-O-)-methyltransferase 2 n=1 Tax=Halocaridina rubra TaxID=373956 RepID=A0AAN8XEJ5_HALRR